VKRALPPYPVNVAALAAGAAAVEDKKTLNGYVREVKRLRAWFTNELEKRGARVFSSAGNFVLADLGDAGPALFRELKRRGILVREKNKDLGAGFARISIGTKSEMKKLLRLVPRAV
jgi:histidinol-phosphate aminotransferase